MPKAERIPDWSHLSYPQVNALVELEFAIPIHQSYLTKRLGIRMTTVRSLVHKDLVRQMYLYEEHPGLGRTTGMPFFTLTQEGQRIVRDWHSWNKKVESFIQGVDFKLPDDWPNENKTRRTPILPYTQDEL